MKSTLELIPWLIILQTQINPKDCPNNIIAHCAPFIDWSGPDHNVTMSQAILLLVRGRCWWTLPPIYYIGKKGHAFLVQSITNRLSPIYWQYACKSISGAGPDSGRRNKIGGGGAHQQKTVVRFHGQRGNPYQGISIFERDSHMNLPPYTDMLLLLLLLSSLISTQSWNFWKHQCFHQDLDIELTFTLVWKDQFVF